MIDVFLSRGIREVSILVVGIALAQSLPLVKAAEEARAVPSAIYLSVVLEPGGQADIHCTRPDGSTRQNLTADFDQPVWAPVVSPDGTRVVFGSWQNGNQIWVMAADGSNKRQLAIVNEPFASEMGGWLDNDTLVFNADLDEATLGGQPVRSLDGKTYYDWNGSLGMGEAVPFGLNVKQTTARTTGTSAIPEPLTRPEINLLWVPQSVGVGAEAVFRVQASGNPTPSYRWQCNGQDLEESDRVQGVASAALTIGSARWGDAGTYTVVVYNSVGSVTSRAATLKVLEPAALKTKESPVEQSGSPGAAVGAGINGLVVGTSLRVEERKADLSARNIHAAAVMAVRAPLITSPPQDQLVKAGATAHFEVVATGEPAPTYLWKRNGKVLAEEGRIMGARTAHLEIREVRAADAGFFTVTVANSAGQVTTKAVKLALGLPPTIKTQPQSAGVLAGKTVNFRVSVAGMAPLTYQWHFNGIDLMVRCWATAMGYWGRRRPN